MTTTQIYYNLFLMVLFLWLGGLFSTRRVEGNLKISLPGWLSRFLFIKKVKNKIMIQTLLLQIWVYTMTISVFFGYKLGFINNLLQVMNLYFKLTLGTALIYLIITIPDMIVYSIKNKKRLF